LGQIWDSEGKMATISRRGDLQWQAKVRVKGYAPASKTFNTRDDAELWAKTVESEMGRGIFVDRSEAEGTTLYEALERYEREVSKAKKGHEQEKWRIKAWKADSLAKRSLASLRGADFSKWRDARLESVSPATVRLDLALLSHLFTYAAKEWGIGVTNPVQSIRMPKVSNARERRLEGTEEKYLLNALVDSGAGKRANHWMHPLAILAIETGMRQSELLSLEWDKIYLDKGFLRARGIEGRSTKNEDAYRDVPLSIRARSTLGTLPHAIGGSVFPTTQSAVKQAFARACTRAGIEALHFHDLRHEATSRLAEKLALHELMKVTGHKDTRMLARYYHPSAEDLAKKLG
jgi:integrase